MRRTYPGVPVVRGNLVALPLPDRCVDLVVTYQVVEHLWDAPAYVARVRPGAAQRGPAAAVDPEPAGLLPRPRPRREAAQPLPQPGVRRRASSSDSSRRRGSAVEAVLGVHHGDAIAQFEQARGPLVDAQLAGPPESWDSELAGFVAGLTAADFDLRDEGVDEALDLLVIAMRP